MKLLFEDITTDAVNLFAEKEIKVSVLRLDKIHPVISGNKWFKLKYYLDEAKQQRKKTIATFGGAYSNHLIAVSAACRLYSLSSIGIVRGEEPVILSPTLLQAKEFGMRLLFVNREDYRTKKIPAIIENEKCYLINEGGYGKKGADGASEILNYASGNFTHCCCAAGTGTMMAGLIKSVSSSQKVIGLSVLKNNYEIEENIRLLTGSEKKEWQLLHHYHLGGYAKYKPELIRFMNGFYQQTTIPTDFVYTGKLFFAITDLIKNNFFPVNSRLLLVHSGGLQGNRSLPEGTLIF